MASILDEFLILFKPTVQGSGFTTLNKQMKQTHKSLFSMKNMLSAFVGYDIYTGIKAIGGSLVNASKEMGAFRSRFYAITGDEKKANEQLEWAFKLAEKTAMPMKAVADSYSIFYAATQRGLGDQGAQQVFQNWTEVSRVLHMSEYQFERVTYALREMASKGVVYSQDLRMQIGTHVPNAVALAEKAVNDLGITGTDWFEQFQKKSKGNQQMINQFLMLFSKYAKEMFADSKALEKALMQPDAQLIRLRQQWDKLRYAMADSGFTDDLMKVLMKVNNLLDKITAHSKEFYRVLKAIAKVALAIGGLAIFRKLTKFILTFGMGAESIGGRIFKLIGRLGIGRFARLFTGSVVKRLLSFGLRGVIAFIPVIGQIISVLWFVWDIITLIWEGVKIFFPDLGKKIKDFLRNSYMGIITLISLVVFAFNPLIAVIIFVTGLIVKLIDKFNLVTKLKDKFHNMLHPEEAVWKEYKSKANATSSGSVKINNGGSVNQVNNININANGLSEEQASELIANELQNNNNKLMGDINKSVANSKW